MWGEKNKCFYNFQQKPLNKGDTINYRVNFKIYIGGMVMYEKALFFIIVLSSMVGNSIGYLIFFKALKNPFRYIANTRKKKIISIVVLIILCGVVGIIFDSFNIYFKEIFQWTIIGVLTSINSRIINTEREDKKMDVKKVE